MNFESILHPFGITDYIFCGVLAVLAILSWYYHIVYYGKIRRSQVKQEFNKPVSLVIAARNELANLQAHLPLWLGQKNIDFELIIADDGSTDGTSDWIVEQMGHEPRLKLVRLDPEYVKMHGKKIALTLAFKKAVHDYFVLSDADCKPASEYWLVEMASQLNEKDIVLGYSPYEKRPGFLNSMIRYETFVTALNYLGFAQAAKPYMGVGRNLAYSRSIYNRVNGFASHSHIPAGDDDLFVQSASNAQNTVTCLTANSAVLSIPKNTWGTWWKQKRRHLWTGKYYNPASRKMLAALPMIQLGTLALATAWCILGVSIIYPIALVILKFILEWYVKARKTAILQSKDLRWGMPIFSLIYLFFYVILGISAFFARKPKW